MLKILSEKTNIIICHVPGGSTDIFFLLASTFIGTNVNVRLQRKKKVRMSSAYYQETTVTFECCFSSSDFTGVALHIFAMSVDACC